MAETLGCVDLQYHFVVDSGVSFSIDLARHKKQLHGRRTGVEFDYRQGMPILCESASRHRRCDGYCIVGSRNQLKSVSAVRTIGIIVGILLYVSLLS